MAKTAANGDAAPTTAASDGDVETRLRDLAHRAESIARERAELLRSQAEHYVDEGRERLDEAGRYLTERVQEKPLQTTAIALGVGVVIGLLLGGRR